MSPAREPFLAVLDRLMGEQRLSVRALAKRLEAVSPRPQGGGAEAWRRTYYEWRRKPDWWRPDAATLDALAGALNVSRSVLPAPATYQELLDELWREAVALQEQLNGRRHGGSEGEPPGRRRSQQGRPRRA